MTNNNKESIKKKIIIAIPKGRILKELVPILQKVKIIPEKSFYKNNNRNIRRKRNYNNTRINSSR